MPKFSVPDHPVGCTYGIGTRKSFFFEPRNFHTLQIFLATIQAAEFLRVPPKSSFKKLLLSTGLWLYTKMSTTLKSCNGWKNSECKKGQLSNRPPIPYVAEMDIVTPKEEPQVMKVKLPNNSHIKMPIYSCGNTKECLMHIVPVLCIIKQKGLDVKCRKLGKAVVRQSKTLKNLLKAAGSRDTVSMDVDF